jgi:hypothetical protein
MSANGTSNERVLGDFKHDASMLSALNFVHTIGYSFIISPVSLFGLATNLACLLVFLSDNMNRQVYIYFRAKTLGEIVITSIGTLIPIGTCRSCFTYNTYHTQIYRFIVNNCLLGIVYTFCGLMEIAIVYDRYLIVKKNSRCLCRASKTLVLAFCAVASTLFTIPQMFSQKIVPTGHTAEGKKYHLVSSDFGKSKAYLHYQIGFSFVRSVIFFHLILLFSVLLVCEFKRYVRKKKILMRTTRRKDEQLPSNDMTTEFFSANSKSLTSREKKRARQRVKSVRGLENRAHRNVTKMVITLSVIFLISRCVQFLAIAYSVYSFARDQNSAFNIYFSFLSYLLTYSSSGMHFFIYLKFNRAFRRCFRQFKIFQTCVF